MLSAKARLTAGRLRAAMAPRSDLAARLLSGSVFSLLGALVSRGFGFVVTLLVVRLLGREPFGEFSMIQSTLGVLGTAAGMGLAATATKYVAEHREEAPERAGAILGLVNAAALGCGLAMAAGCYAGADALAAGVLARPELAPLLRTAAIAIPIMTLDGVQTAVLSGLEAFRRIAQVTVAAAAVSTVVFAVAVWTEGLRGSVQALVISAAVSLALSSAACTLECRARGLRRDFGSMLAEARLIWRYSFPALGSGLTYLMVFWIANLILVRAPEGYGQLGALRVVDQLRTMLVTLPTVLLAPTFSIMSNVSNQPATLARILDTSIASAGLVVFPAGLALTFVATPLLTLLYGPDMASGGVALACAMIVAGMQATGLGLGNVLNATGQMWFGFAMNVIWGVVFIALAVVLIPTHGATGYLVALAVAYAVLNVLAYGRFLSRNAFLRPGRVFAPLIAYVAAVAGGVSLLPWLGATQAVLAASASGLLMAACLGFVAHRAFTRS